MSILCTFPGRYGDLLWALPSIRALARRLDAPIDLQIAGEFANIVPLLGHQPYLGHVFASPGWEMHPPHAHQAPPREGYDLTLHLGYRGWPQRALPFETLDCLNAQWGSVPRPAPVVSKLNWQTPFHAAELALDAPWIVIDGPTRTPGGPPELAVGFTEAWFELKFGLLVCLDHSRSLPSYLQLTPPGSRWTIEGRGLVDVLAGSWETHARVLQAADLFFGDCSALHVLACALGTPVLLMEPMEGRWNDIFYPYGKTGPQVTLITGSDGRPTFDARHCADAIEAAFKRRVERQT